MKANNSYKFAGAEIETTDLKRWKIPMMKKTEFFQATERGFILTATISTGMTQTLSKGPAN